MDEDSWSFLTLIINLFGSKRQIARRRFIQGYALIFEGIAFFVDPQNSSLLYAASPSEDESESRMNLIVSEVVRVLPTFVAEHSHLGSALVNRKLVIRMIRSYRDKQGEFVREVSLDWDMLN